MLRMGLIATLIFWAGTLGAEQISGSSFSSDNWVGAAYTFDETGSFSHCAISARYKSGNTLYFSINSDATVSIAVSGQLGLQRGQRFPVALYIDRRQPFYGNAEAVDENFALLNLDNFSAAMDAFKRGFVLKIEALGQLSEYSLQGTYRALTAARECVERHYRYSSTSATPNAVDKTAMFQISTSVISSLGIYDFRYLSPAELAERGWEKSVAWVSEGHQITGLSTTLPSDGITDLRETDPADTQFIASSCGGDYATSARSMDLDGVAAGRELRLICNTGQTTEEFYLSKFFAGDKVVYSLLIFGGSATRSELPRSHAERSKEATVFAAKFMLE